MPFLIHNIDPARQPLVLTHTGKPQTIKHNESIAVDLREKTVEITRLLILGKINLIQLDRMPVVVPSSLPEETTPPAFSDSEQAPDVVAKEAGQVVTKKTKSTVSGE